MMNTENITNFRKNMSTVLDSVEENSDVTVITRGNKPASVVMSLKHFNGMMETMHLLSSPANAARLMDSVAQVKAGNFEEKELIQPDNA